MLRLKTSVNVLPQMMKEDKPPPAPPTENVLPWNLRKRRGDCIKGKELKIDVKEPNCSLPKPRNVSDKLQKVKFSMELSKKEIMEDFIAILGHPPPRKPNKRPKVGQNQLNVSCIHLLITSFQYLGSMNTDDDYANFKIIKITRHGAV